MNEIDALKLILHSPWYKWHTALALPKPKWWQPWKLPKFIKGVEITKKVIDYTLKHNFLNTPYVPRIDFFRENDLWILNVHTWGNPWETKIHG